MPSDKLDDLEATVHNPNILVAHMALALWRYPPMWPHAAHLPNPTPCASPFLCACGLPLLCAASTCSAPTLRQVRQRMRLTADEQMVMRYVDEENEEVGAHQTRPSRRIARSLDHALR